MKTTLIKLTECSPSIQYIRMLRIFVAGLIFLCDLGVEYVVMAAQISPFQAEQAVQAWLRADVRPLNSRIGNRVQLIETHNDNQGSPLYYVVCMQPSGYVVVPADDLVEPIIAFVARGRYDPSPDNPLGALVSSDMSNRMQRVKQQAGRQAGEETKKIINKWTLLRGIEQMPLGVKLGLSSVSDVRISPLLQSSWDQLDVGGSACYNYYTPPYASGSSSNYYCGCVATAMGQLMRYHEYPISGVGTSSFSIAVKGVETTRSLRGGDGSGGAYPWHAMVLQPAADITIAQRQAIGVLVHDAGVSVNMDYGDYAYGGSGTDTLKAKDALIQTFKYANAIKGYNSGSTIGAGLNTMVNPNLDASYPVLFGILGASVGGHAIVCDGYGYNLDTLYHHLNLGWSGSDDAWYALPTIDTSQGEFNIIRKCVYNVYPAGSGEIISGRVMDGDDLPISGATVTAVRVGGGTYSSVSGSNGIYALEKLPSDSEFNVVASWSEYKSSSKKLRTKKSSDDKSTSGNQWGVDFTVSPTLELGPSIFANGQTGTVTVSPSDTIELTVTMNAGIFLGLPVDWWVLAVPQAGEDWYYMSSDLSWNAFAAGNQWACRPVYCWPLINIIEPLTIFTGQLPLGTYDFYFGVDFPMSWFLEMLPGCYLFKSVRVVVSPYPAAPDAEMMFIPAGNFAMGNVFNEGRADERPAHAVQVSSFCMEENEVSKAKWDEVYRWATAQGYAFNNPGKGKGTNHPVHSVSWYDCVKWCNARSEMKGLKPAYYTTAGKTTVYRTGQVSLTSDCVDWSANGYRLPTEAEWEKAARGGAVERRFAWSFADTITHDRANYFSSSSYAYDVSATRGFHPEYKASPYPYTSPIKSFAANGYGLYDMTGNVWEWCWDRYGADYYAASTATDPHGPDTGTYRASRGGSWYQGAFFARLAFRFNMSPTSRNHYLGFRCVRRQL